MKVKNQIGCPSIFQNIFNHKLFHSINKSGLFNSLVSRKHFNKSLVALLTKRKPLLKLGSAFWTEQMHSSQYNNLLWLIH